ncbi:MAG: 1-aminocyclopropane-1-carboxylate deaminase/D-cysteine desulfhydrase [Flavobacterium sp.]|jgi:1-aminocyclopropane-1-carboxylate deaminase|uniref:1-aminocyclopropane-1-carboxylate deaminase/D-cysteine desulfhydrase n=1 Tax=Flavobacterium sp. TaxID=239 RepID=UPI003BA77D55
MERITENQFVGTFKNNIRLYIKREDLIHPFISGNKFRKLFYNLSKAKEDNHATLLTFGGAYSNHIAAVAFAGKKYGFQTIGVIRGEELLSKINENPTLTFAQQNGMQFVFESREKYRKRHELEYIETLREMFGYFYLIPEGGTNALAVKGCKEILTVNDAEFDYICCCVGTGGTISGIINSSLENQKVIGFPSLKGNFLKEEIQKWVTKDNWELNHAYHFGGYAKINRELVEFMNDFFAQTTVLLDPVYTGKMIYGIYDLIEKGYFTTNSKILAIHSGGIQGIEGMNQKLERLNLPKIRTNV